MRGEVQRSEDFADERTHHRKGQLLAACVPALLLKKRVCDGRKNDMPIPAGKGSALEVVEAEFVFELLILLLDGPSLVRSPNESLQRSGPRKMNEEIFGDGGAADRSLQQQPHLG